MRMEFTDWSWWGWAFGYALQGDMMSGLGVFVSFASYRCLLCSMYIPFYFSCSFTIYYI